MLHFFFFCINGMNRLLPNWCDPSWELRHSLIWSLSASHGQLCSNQGWTSKVGGRGRPGCGGALLIGTYIRVVDRCISGL